MGKEDHQSLTEKAERKIFRTSRYILATVLSIAALSMLLGEVGFVYWFTLLGLLQYAALISAFISGIALLVTALGTASTVMLAWRDEERKKKEEERKSREFVLKIEQ